MGELWHGGKIYTMTSEGDLVDAVYVEQGVIVEKGDYTSLKTKYESEIDTTYNLEGKVMYPGLVDSHLHIIGHGEKIAHLDLSMMTSPDQVIDALKDRVTSLEKDEWLIGEGWNENQWEDPRILHRDELDDISPDNPMILSRVCRHAVLANSLAMELAGVNGETRDPQGGKVIRDENGQATGYFLDTAQEYIKNVVPHVTENQLTKLVETSIDDLLQLGLVGGHSEDLAYYGGFNKTLRAFQRAIDGKERKFRAHLLVHHEVFEDRIRYQEDEKENDYIELGAMKIFADGALGGRTAWLSSPYEDDPDNYGIPIHSTEELENLVQQARQHEMPVAVHAIGDQAVMEIANIIKKYPLHTNGKRDRIIHAQIINDELLDILKSINVVLDIQPTFVASDFPWIIDRIGEKRVKYAYPWKTFLERNIPCAAGSDAPIEKVDPLLGIEAAVLRKSSIDGKSYNEQEKLTVYEALALYTVGSAYIIGQENSRGQIEEGYLADFTVLDQDLFHIPADTISNARVEFTIVNGDIVYSRRG
ncbi:amidohydrolase [Aquibacillus koreensis]|uniref:Amidohydrolase n=1 Tax=Aquibacillus koreensis TaxID=279446 RepID=A0A9X3WHX8_9BACI|nr:amidohydrolase [Aquibacillus koreensis]MCT2534991.1 amidohydrolase [Aquibacillus koreensis]MDC3419278.1 amidohydrolase [Aquibacillus koreensis]